MAESKVAIVTGAGSGIGHDTALLLAEAGYHVALVARTESKLQDTAKAIAEQSPNVETLVVARDLTDPAAPAEIVEQVKTHFGRIDALVNNAGYAVVQPIADTSADTWCKTVDVNLTAPILLTAAVLPIMQEQGDGIIVNISSMAAFDPFPGFGLYAPVKTAINMFTRVTGDEGKKFGVKAVAIAPGAVETPLLRSMFSEQMLPAKKTLDPMSVAGAIRDCVVGSREFENGETIPMPSP